MLPRFIDRLFRKLNHPTFGLILALITFGLFFYQIWQLSDLFGRQEKELNKVSGEYASFLELNHLSSLENVKLAEAKRQLEEDYQKLKSDVSVEKLAQIEEVYKLYQDSLLKIDRNNKVKIETNEINNQLNDWGQKLLKQEFTPLKEVITKANQTLDQNYQTYLASPPPPAPAKPPSIPVIASAPGYEYKTVSTSRGSFNTHLIKMKLSEVQVKTLTANSENCLNDCPTKSLESYVKENNAYAGINGTYFCPQDYASCAGKTKTYDFAVYNSNLGIWLNASAMTWESTGMATFNGSSAKFYRIAKDYTGDTVTAAVSNFPPLLVQNGQIIVDESSLTAKQKSKGTVGMLGTGGENIYLAIINGASLPDAASVMQALGAKDVLNLDGGGSSALYIDGAYKVGPGRALPNAIILTR